MKKYILCVFAILYYFTMANAQNITQMEYFVDADPGYGSGTAVSFTAGNPVNVNFSVSLTATSDGFHFLSLRAKDANNKWSEVAVRPFYRETLPTAALPNITAMEYFIDNDLGYGNGTPITGFTAGSNVSHSFTIPLTNTVADGFHFLSLRAKDANNKWSVAAVRPFFKETLPTAALPNITAMEYFIDNDLGYGNGTPVTGFTAGATVNQSFQILLTNTLSDGFHFISLRAKDANNKWSVVAVRPFFKETLPSAALPNITAMEYFIDNDTGYGNGTPITGFTAGTTASQSFQIPLTNALSDGFHFISLRAKDANNKWSEVAVRPFYKETLPTAALPNITAMEYFIDNDTGYGNVTPVTGFTAGTTVNQSFTVSLGSLSNGSHQLFFRAKDANNKWSIVGTKSFAVQDNIIVVGNIPTQWCVNTAFNIPFSITGTYTAGNIFTAQLSDINGSFTSPTSIGTLTTTSTGTISATIPNGTSLSNNYKIRIISSTPSITNTDSKPFQLLSVCPPPCAGLLTLAHPADDILSGDVTKQASSTNGSISATNYVQGSGTKATYQAKSITLNAGFRADNGVVFRAEIGGCGN